MRKKSTLALGMIINKIVSNMRDGECFLNIGVWKGFTLFAGMVGNESKVCIGVDNFSQFGSPRDYFVEKFRKLKSENHYFYEMSYEEYFEHVHRGNIGFYIYDGHHGYENQLNNLLEAEQFFSEGCIVMIDDTNFSQVRKATLDFIATSKNTYEILVDAKTPRDRHMTFWNGVMIFQKKG